MNEKGFLESILKEGSDSARYRARKTMQKVYRKIGFPQIR